MIRPLTCICMLLAGGSGLYLYQSKHRAQMLDREIARTLKATDTARDRIGVLRGEWALLNEPERLDKLSHTHLGLKTLLPTQFVAWAELSSRLPPPAPPGTVFNEAEALVTAEPVRPSILRTAPAPATPPPAAAAPVQVAARPRPAPRPPAAAPSPNSPSVVSVAASQIAPAPPGMSIGESVARMARLRAGQAETAPPAYTAPARSAPAYTAPAYTAPAYTAPAYTPPYTPVSPSVLGGGRQALPAPVPYGSTMASNR